MDAQRSDGARSQHESLKSDINSLHAQRLHQLDQAASSHRERGAKLKQVLSEQRRILQDLSKSMEMSRGEDKDGLIEKLGGLSQFFKPDTPGRPGHAASRYDVITKGRRKNFKLDNLFLAEEVSQTDSSMCNFEAASDFDEKSSAGLDVFDTSAITDEQTPRVNTLLTSGHSRHEGQCKLIRNGMIVQREAPSQQLRAQNHSPVSEPDQLNLVDSIHLDILDQEGLHLLWTMEKEFAIFVNKVKHLEHTMQVVSSSLHHTLQRQNMIVSELRGELLDEVNPIFRGFSILPDLSNQLYALKNAVGSLRQAKDQLEQELADKDEHIKSHQPSDQNVEVTPPTRSSLHSLVLSHVEKRANLCEEIDRLLERLCRKKSHAASRWQSRCMRCMSSWQPRLAKGRRDSLSLRA
eukprot:767178-Hanusia_phi.AAC.7